MRVSGAIAMKNMLQDFKFEAGRFLELLGRAVRGVVALIGEMSESATMTYILNIIADLVDAMGEHIRPYMEDARLIFFLFMSLIIANTSAPTPICCSLTTLNP